MKIVISSAASSEAGTHLNEHLVFLSDALNSYFATQSYGEISHFIVIVVAVDSDEQENQRFGKSIDKVGRFKDPLTAESLKHISFALPFDPANIVVTNGPGLREMVCKALIDRLADPRLKIPKAFKYVEFASDLTEKLEILRRAQ